MLHRDDNLVESKMEKHEMLKIFKAERFFLIHNPGNGKTFSLFLFHSLILSFVSTAHTHKILMRNGKIMSEREPFHVRGRGKVGKFSVSFFQLNIVFRRVREKQCFARSRSAHTQDWKKSKKKTEKRKRKS